MTQATAGNSAPARAVLITSEQLDAYNTRQRELGREAIRLRAKKDAAMKAIYAAKGFIAHRYASARHAIAVERCDAAFNMRTWGYDSGRMARRQAVIDHVRFIRGQIAEARARYAAEAVQFKKAA